LDQALKALIFYSDPAVLVDSANADDAGIYKLNDETAMVHTLDFFTPIVDDPYLFGQIAAANAVSDIYAMGAKPLNALNIICYPDTVLDQVPFQAILQGGIDKMHEAGVVILGGHSVRDSELKYGLSVNGIIHPDRIKRNHNLQPGDRILLTKPIGTGILSTALKNDALTEDDIEEAVRSMSLLNRLPAQLFDTIPISACTDVTGFGLLGHLWEMIQGTSLGVHLEVGEISMFDRITGYASAASYIPGGTLANIEFITPHLEMGSFPVWYQMILCDPQTSGGLLIGMKPADCDSFIDRLGAYPFPVKIIGTVESGPNKIFLH
jgi:selenide,water dikinase